jgi:hypothetical protein
MATLCRIAPEIPVSNLRESIEYYEQIVEPEEPAHFALTKFTSTLMRVSIGWPSRCVGRNSQAFTASSAALARL